MTLSREAKEMGGVASRRDELVRGARALLVAISGVDGASRTTPPAGRPLAL